MVRKVISYMLIASAYMLGMVLPAHATHVMGGDIYYNCLGGNQYEVTVIIYRDCNSNVAIGPNLTVRSASLGSNLTPNMPRVGGPTQITPTNNSPSCNGTVSVCQEQNIFRGIVTLPPANDWIFGVNQACCRNAGNNLPRLGSQYIEATLDNLNGACNSSPTFFGSGVHVLCINSDYILDPGICELDGDSLGFELIETRQTVNNSTAYVPPFTAANPLPSTPAINLNPLTGEIAIRPTGSSGYVAVFAMRIDEYRNGVKIGSVVREYQIYYIACPSLNTPPTFGNITNLSGGIMNDDQIDVCPGDTLKFDIAGNDLDLTDSLFMRDSLPLPGAILTNVINGNSVSGQFCWVAPMTPEKFHMVFKLRDNGCPVFASTVKVLTINIQDGSTILGAAAKFSCSNGSNPATLTAFGGSTFNWSVVSGDMNSLNGLTTNVASLQVNPTVTTTYTVATDFVCSAPAPQVTVTVLNPPTLQTGGDTSLCGLQNVPLSSTVAGGSGGPFLYSWFPAGTVSDSSSANPTVSPTDTTVYTLSVTDPVSGCIVTSAVQVDVSAPYLAFNPTLSGTTYCPGGPPITLNSNTTAGNCASYKVRSIPHRLDRVNLATSQIIPLGIATTSGAIPLGFDLDFYCQKVDTIYVSSGGWFTFNNPALSPFTRAQSIPSATSPNGIVAFIWSDLVMSPFSGSFLSYSVSGTAPNRIGYLTMLDAVSVNINNNQNTVQVKLFEATGDIEIHLSRVNTGTSNTIGVEAPGGAQGVAAPGRNNTPFSINSGDEEAWRFSYDRGSPYTVTWYEAPLPPGVLVGTGDSINVTPTNPTTYCAVVTDNGSGCTDTFCYPTQVTAANLAATGPAGPLPIGSTPTINTTYTGILTPNCTDYLVAKIPYAPEPSGGTTLTMTDDDTQGPFNLGFNFDWYCSPFSQVWVNSNGWLSFTNPNSTVPGTFTIPDPGAPTNLISFLGTDLEPNAGGTINYQTLGTAGNRRFVLTYTNVPYYASTNLVSIQLILYEANGFIEVHCSQVDADPVTRITQGIQLSTVNGETTPGRNFILLQNQVLNDAVRFRPQENNVVYSWTSNAGNGVFQDSTLKDPTTNPLGLASSFYVFYVEADNGDCILRDTVIIEVGALPEQTFMLDAIASGDQTELSWDFLSDDAISHFIVEHKPSGEDFEALATLPYDDQKTYTFLHESLPLGVHQYRIRAVDFQGAVSYSNIREITLETAGGIYISPNPGKERFNLSFQADMQGQVPFDVFDSQGRRIFSSQINVERAGEQHYPFMLKGVSAGVYVYEISVAGRVLVGKLVVR